MNERRYLKSNGDVFAAEGEMLTVPQELPYVLRVHAVWSGNAEGGHFGLFTPQQWEQFSNCRNKATEFAFGGTIYNHINDSVLLQEIRNVDSKNWVSGKLNSWLSAYCGEKLVAAIIGKNSEDISLQAVRWRFVSEREREDEIISCFSETFLAEKGIADAFASGDRAKAVKYFCQYFKQRQLPVFPRKKDCSDEERKIADMALDHVYQPQPIVHEPEKIEPFCWDADPMNLAQWTIAWNRHGHWNSLARAYDASGEEKYAQEFAFELSEWLQQIPLFLNQSVSFLLGTEYEPGRLSHFLDAGIRLSGSWWESFEVFRRSKAVTPEIMLKFFDGVIQQAEYLADERACDIYGNWGAAAAAGLLTAAVMLPECSLARHWKAVAIERIRRILDAQFYPDGAQIELTPTYQCGAVEHIVSALELAEVNGVVVEGIDRKRFEQIFDYMLKIATPNRTAPAFNDSPWKPLQQIFRTAHRLFPKRRDFLWFASDGQEGQQPEEKSIFLPYAGYAIMRTGYSDADYYTAFDVGPFGFSHQHEDKLNFVISFGKTVLLSEAGVYNYDYSPRHLYALSSRAHNVILVDGLPQRRADKKETYMASNPLDAGWISNDEFDYARGRYSDGYSNGEIEVSVTHEREIQFYKKEPRWSITDTLVPEDETEHSYEVLFHFDADTLCYHPKQNSIIAERNGKRMIIKPSCGFQGSVRIITGQMEPEVQGWGRVDSGEVIARPVVIYSWKATGTSQLVWDIRPYFV